jgi:hypothetical protein
MKWSILLLSGFLSFNLLAQTEVEVRDEKIEVITAEDNQPGKIKIAEIKELLNTMNPDSTCLDEYMKRRRQLIIRLAATPAVMAGGVMAPAALGFATTFALNLTGIDAYVSLVIGLGTAVYGVAGEVISLVGTNNAAFALYDVDLIIKTLGEYYLNRPGKKLSRLHERYSKRNCKPSSEEDFLRQLVELDQSGKLCDGSLIKQPRIKIGSKLKYKIARTKHLREAIH